MIKIRGNFYEVMGRTAPVWLACNNAPNLILSNTGILDHDEVTWVEPPDFVRPAPGLFIAKVLGESMNRKIPNAKKLFQADAGA